MFGEQYGYHDAVERHRNNRIERNARYADEIPSLVDVVRILSHTEYVLLHSRHASLARANW